NRLIIATRLLKNADSHVAEEPAASATGSVLQPERQALAGVKRLTRAALGTVAETFGSAARDQQEVLGLAANMIVECYALESTIGRAEKMVARRGERATIAADVARVYTSHAIDRVAHPGKQNGNALAGRGGGEQPPSTAAPEDGPP